MASLNLPTEFSDSQIDEMVGALKKLGKYPFTGADGSSGSQVSHMSIPKLPNFSGEVPVPKGEVGFEVWRFEVSCLRLDGLHSEVAVTQGARKSLRGEAARIVMNSLGHQATIADILDKFEGIYGAIETGEELMQKFYNAVQCAGESTASWGCRLEDLLTKATHHKKTMSPSVKDEMLRTRFWNGLYDSTLKNITHYKYETISSFDELRREIRKMDQELSSQNSGPRKGSRAQHHVQVTEDKDRIDHLSSKLDSLEQKLELFVKQGQSKTEDVSAKILEQMDRISNRLDRLENLAFPVQYGQGQGQYQCQGYEYRQSGPSFNNRGHASQSRRGGRGAAFTVSNRNPQSFGYSRTSPGNHLN